LATVFLSYATEENGFPQDGVSRGWVDYFDECLRLELDRLPGGTTLWRDVRDLNTPGVISARLGEEVDKAEIFLNVLSPRYGTKPYTQYELDRFLSRPRGPGQRASDSIIPMMVGPIDVAQIPPPLRDLKYISFFKLHPVTKAVQPFFDGYGRTITTEYFDAVRNVVNFIARRLAELQGVAGVAAGTTVYLAAPGPDQVSNHWKIYNELESQKCRIAPIEPWPIENDRAKDYFGTQIKTARFSVHLLGALSGVARRDDLNELSAKQLEWAAARQHQDENFRRLIWIPPDLRDPDPSQRDLIKSLDDGTQLNARDELVRDGLEAFKEVIRDELARAAAPGGAVP
jgi:TIR domain